MEGYSLKFKFLFFVNFIFKLARTEIITALNSTTTALIAHVLHGTDTYPHHFVLVCGWDTDDENIYYVKDSFYNNTYYNIS